MYETLGNVKINFPFIFHKFSNDNLALYLEADEKTRNVLEMGAFSNLD